MVTQRAHRRVQDRYELLEPLGRGGMGVVWLAEDDVLQRKVAVKQVEIPSGVPADEVESMRARVMREARAAARLNHPNVTTIFDVVNDGDTTWIVMEYVAAPTVTEVVSQQGPMSVQRTAEVGLGVLSALEAAHAAGIIHRDVKPGNVMVPGKGHVKLADFGVAAVQGDPKITMTGLIIGSPSYMAPEQAQEGVSTAASDMWGLGTTLYYAVEGRPAFDKGAAIPTLTAVSYEPPTPMERAGSLAPILERLLEKNPDDRLTAGELRVLLEEIVGDADHWGTPAAAVAPQTIVLDDEPTAVAAPTVATPTLAAAPVTAADPEADAADEGWDAEPDQRYEQRRSAWPWIIAAMVLLSIAGLTLPTLLDDDTQVARTAAEEEPAVQEEAGAGNGAEAGGAAANDDAAADEQAADAGDAAVDSGVDEEPVEQEPVDEADPPAADDDTAETQASGDTSGVTVPADWTTFTVGNTGTTVAHPADWTTRSRSGTATDIRDPNGGRYLRVDYTETPGDDAVADWERQSDSFAQRHSNYSEIAIEEYDYPGAQTAALWEYTYQDGGAQLHAYNLAIVIGGRGYALNFQTRESQWASSQELWEQFVAGFEPAQ